MNHSAHQPLTFPAPQPSTFPAPQLGADQRLPLGEFVDDAMVAHHRSTAKATLIVGLVAIVGAVLAFKFLPAGDPSASYRRRKWNPQSVGAGVCILVAIHAFAKAASSHRVASILRGARWHRSTYRSISETRGDLKIHHLTLTETGVTYRPISRLIGPSDDYGTFLEWTGDADGYIVVRAPHARKAHVYRPITAQEAERSTVRWK